MKPNNTKGDGELDRFSNLSDGIFAVIITIMVLALKTPERYDLGALLAQWPDFVSYAISYAFIAVVWMNHHFVFKYAQQMTGRLAWSNFANLFCISFIPFTTSWMAASKVAPSTVTVYSLVFFLVEATYMVLMYETFSQARIARELGARSMRPQWIRAWIMLIIFGLSGIAWFIAPFWRLALLASFLVFHLSPALKKST